MRFPPRTISGSFHQVREAVRSAIPADATVLVVSRGDEELLKLDGRTAWHFPRFRTVSTRVPPQRQPGGARAPGRVAHPRRAVPRAPGDRAFGGSTSTVIRVQNLRPGHGAVFEDDSCIIFRPRRTRGCRPPRSKRPSESAHSRDRAGRPPAAAATRAWPWSRQATSDLLRLGGRAAVDFPQFYELWSTDSHESSREIRGAGANAGEGVEYLVVPYISPSWLDLHPDFRRRGRAPLPCVARRRNVGSVFVLADSGSPADETDGGQQQRTGLAGRLARWLAGAGQHHPRSWLSN